MKRREGNRPDRRIVPAETYSELELNVLAALATYAGSGLHKRECPERC